MLCVETMGEMVKRWRELSGLNTSQLARLAGVNRQNIEQFESNEVLQPRYLPELAKAMQCTVDDIHNLRMPQPLLEARTNLLKLVRGTDPGGSEAHPMIQSAFHAPSTLTWERTMTISKEDLPAQFICAVPDDALTPDTPKGTLLIFSRDAQPRVGWGILVEDRNGVRYVRRYVQSTGNGWSAKASHRDYVSLDPVEHGLTILAVASWRGDGSV